MKKIGIFIALFVFCMSSANAQSAKRTQAYNNLTDYENTGDVSYLITAKERIDEAALHEKTMNSVKTHVYRGKIYYNLASLKGEEHADLVKGAAKTAIEAFTKVMDLENETGKKRSSKDALLGIMGLTPALYNTGLNCYNASDFGCAYENFNQVVGISRIALENNIEGAAIDTSALSAAAFAADRAEMADEAMVLYKELIDLDYQDANIYLGMARLTKGDESQKYINDGLKKFPDDKALNIENVNRLLTSGNQEDAVKSMKDALKSDPDNASLHFALGTTYDALAEVSKKNGDMTGQKANLNNAIESYKNAIDLKSDYFNAFFNLGAVYFNQVPAKADEMNNLPISDTKNYDRLNAEIKDLLTTAQPYLETAHQLNPTDLASIQALKEVYARTNNLEKMSEMKKLFDKLSSEMK